MRSHRRSLFATVLALMIGACVASSAHAQMAEDVKPSSAAAKAAADRRQAHIDSMGLLGLRPQGHVTSEQYDRALDLLEEFLPPQAARLRRLREGDRPAFEQTMRELEAGRQMIALAWLENREPELFAWSLDEVRVRQELKTTVARAQMQLQPDDEALTNIRRLVRDQCDLLIRIRTRELILLHQHVSRQKDQLKEDASRIAELVEHKFEQFVASAQDGRSGRYPSMDIQQTSRSDEASPGPSETDPQSLSVEDRALAILMDIDARRGRRLEALRDRNEDRFCEILETTQFGRRIRQLAVLQIEQPSLFALKIQELKVDRDARHLAYRVQSLEDKDAARKNALEGELYTEVQELINLRIRARGYELVQLEEHLTAEMTTLLNDTTNYEQWVESQVNETLQHVFDESGK